MKSFSRFLLEAKETRASEQAKKLGLVGDGHGDWYSAQGEFVAKTVDGQLKFFNKGERVGQRDIPEEERHQHRSNKFLHSKLKGSKFLLREYLLDKKIKCLPMMNF